MQQISSKIKKIFAENWEPFKRKYPHLITPHIDHIVTKSLKCRTEALGCHIVPCKDCDRFRIIRHSCKTRFCSSCSSTYNDLWLSRIESIIWPTPHHHLVFTIPADLRPLVKINPTLVSALFTSAAQALKTFGRKHGVIIPVFFVLQTFGSRLTYNPHLHGGVPRLVPTRNVKELKEPYFEIHTISKIFVALFVRKIRALYKRGKLVMPAELRFQTYAELNCYLDRLVRWCFLPRNSKSWCVHITHWDKDSAPLVSYMGRYLRTPPISEARIEKVLRKKILFWVKDYTLKEEDFQSIPIYSRCVIRLPKERRKKRRVLFELPIDNFIASTIQHIPPRGFKIVRLYGPYANRSRQKLWSQIEHLFPPRMEKPAAENSSSWRERRIKETGSDPMKCPTCGKELKTEEILYPGDILLKRYTFKELLKLKYSEFQKLRSKIIEGFYDTS